MGSRGTDSTVVTPAPVAGQHSQVSRWLHRHGIGLERQLLIVQWALPLVLSAIVFLDEFHEHIMGKDEPLLTEAFLSEIFFFGVLGPIAVWLVLGWVRAEWRQREREQEILQATYNELAAAQERLHALHKQRGELLNRIMHIQEEERRRVAREIHDELGQLLTGLSLNLRVCQDAVPAELPQVQAQLAKINEVVQQTIHQAHRIILDLRPTALDDYGLVPALEVELHQRLDPLGIQVDMGVQGDVETLPSHHATAAFRIIQEAITNVIRHAQARRVQVSLHLTGGGFLVLVDDDGLGPEEATTDQVGDQRGIGILGMQERAAALGGQVTVTPREPHGTRVRLWLPASSGERRRDGAASQTEPPQTNGQPAPGPVQEIAS